MKVLLAAALTAFFLGVDLRLGSAGLCSGLCVYGALYLSGSYGRAFGVTAAMISGVILDAVYDRPYCITPWFCLAAEHLGYWSASRMRFQLPEAPLFAGGIVGAALCCGNDLSARILGCPPPGPDLLSNLIFQMVFGLFFMFALTVLLDFVGRCADLPRFQRIIQERSSRSRRIISRSALRGNSR